MFDAHCWSVEVLPRNRYCSLSQSTSAIIPHSIQRKENSRWPLHKSITVISKGMTSCLTMSTAAWTTNFSDVSMIGCLQSDTVGREGLPREGHRTCYDVSHWWWKHCLIHKGHARRVAEEHLANRLCSSNHWAPDQEHSVRKRREIVASVTSWISPSPEASTMPLQSASWMVFT